MATTKGKTKAEKEKRSKLYNQITAQQMMMSSQINGNVIQAIHENTNFGENDLGEDIKMDFKSLTEIMETVSEQVKDGNLSKLEEMLVCQSYSLQNMLCLWQQKRLV